MLYSLDLHQLNLKNELDPQGIIHLKIDNFLRPLLQKKNIKIEIIVGRGHNSRVNPRSSTGTIPVLRFYTKEYLDILNIRSNYVEEQGKFYLWM